MKIKKVKPKWMILCRTFYMDGGIFNYGMAEIVNFADTKSKADKIAKEHYEKHKEVMGIGVWVLKCEKTYQKGGIAIS